MRPAYAAMDVLVFLSAREGLPITPQEAMAMGVPVVGYDSVGTREVVPKEWRISRISQQELRKILDDNGTFMAREQVDNCSRKIIQTEFLGTISNEN